MTSMLVPPLATAFSVDPSARRGSLDIKLPSAFSTADLIPKTCSDVLHQPGRHIPLMLLRLGETSALFTLVAARRSLKHHLRSPRLRREEQPHTGQALDLPTSRPGRWLCERAEVAQTIKAQGRCHAVAKKVVSFRAEAQGVFVLTPAEDEQADWK